MPYGIEKRGDRWCVVKETSGKSMGCHDTKAEAEAQRKALYANEPEARPAGYKASLATEPSGTLEAFAAREGGSTAAQGERPLQQSRRQLVVAASTGYDFRTEQYMGRDYLVVPVVALVQGVVHAMNSAHAELVTAEEFTRKPGGWNGRPIYHGHPMRDGEPVSGNLPEVLEDESIGIIFNTKVRKSKLTMEAWIDVERASTIAPELLSRIRAKKPIEISVGVFVDTDEEPGEYGGKNYVGSWHDIVPDHLALLPARDEGACSIEMGCGVRAAKGAAEMDPNMYAEWLEPGAETEALLKTLRNIPMSERDKMPDEDFAGPNRSFPIQEPQDVSAAAHSLGRAKGNRNEIKRRIISIAYRKGDTFVAQLPEDWKKKADQAKAAKKNLLQRVLDKFRGAQDADEMSSNDLMRRLWEALKEVEPDCVGVDTYHPVTDPSHVVYTVRFATGRMYDWGEPMYEYKLYERAFDLSDNGVVTLNESRIEVEPVMRYEPVEGAEPTVAKAKDPAPKDAAAGAPCSCHEKHAPASLNSQKEKDMTKTERVKALIAKAKNLFTDADQAILEGASDEQLARFEAAAAAEPTTVEKVVEKVVEKPVDLTRDQAIQKFGLGDAVALAEAAKTKTIEALKATGRCEYSDEELKAMSQKQLDSLVKLAGSNVRAAIDFGGNGAPKDLGAKNEAPEPPSLDEALKADRK